jgi:uracil-DNA glycosylase family 4
VSSGRTGTEELSKLAVEASSCTRCPLAAGRTHVVFGVGNPEAKLMLVGEAPGEEEDRQGEPFVGRSGRYLDELIWQEMGLTRHHLYIANVLKCRPPNNRDPSPDEVASCSPFLEKQIELVDPAVIVTLGNFATRHLLSTAKGIKALRGRVYTVGGRRIVPTYHPAAVLRAGYEAAAEMRADLVRAKLELKRLGLLGSISRREGMASGS